MKPVSAVRATLLSIAIGLAVTGCGGNDDDMSQQEIQYLSHLDQSRFVQRQGELKASTLEARSAIELQPGNPEAYFVIINNLLKAGDARNAERQLTWLEESIPDEAKDANDRSRSALIRAEARLMQGHTEEALDALASMSTDDSALLSERSLLKGRILLAADRLSEAEEAYSEARSLNENSALPLVGLSRVAQAAGDTEQAQEYVAEAEQADPQNAELWLWKAQLAHDAENWPLAEEAYVRALEDIGQYDIMTYRKYETISALIRVLRAQGKPAEAFVYEEILAKSAPGTIKSNLTAAREAYDEGNLEGAASYLEEVLAQVPNHEQSSLMLGMIRFRQGRINEAENLLRPIAELGDSEAASKLLAAARIQMKDPQEARDILDNLSDKDTDPETLALVGIASLSAGDLATGEPLIEKALTLAPDNHALRLRYAGYLVQRDEYEKAIDQAKQVPENASLSEQARLVVIEAQMAAGNTQQAITTAETWIKTQPDNATALIARGNIASRTGNPEQARGYFENARDKAPQLAAPEIALGNLARTREQTEEARAHFQKAVELAPDNRQALQGLAELSEPESLRSIMRGILDEQPAATGPKLVLLEGALLNGDSQEADELTAALLERVDENTPAEAEPLVAMLYNTVAARIRQNGDRERAAEILERARVLFADNEEITLQAAAVAFADKDPNTARGLLQEAKKLHPDSASPYIVEARYFEEREDYNQAAELYQLAYEKESNGDIANGYARNLQRAGLDTDALAFLESVIERYPDNAQLRLGLAILQQSHGKEDRAKVSYEQLLVSMPDNTVVLNNLAWLYHKAGDDRAISLAQKAYELSPENAAVADTYGWIMLKSGKHQESVPILEKAHQLQPESEEIALHLAEAYRTVGKSSEAQRLLEQFANQG
ncbi:MAG: tetratricopeptide repeat protein [Pseudomonadota bacterium]